MLLMQHHQYTKSYHRCEQVQEVMSGSIQMAEVVNQASHMFLAHLLKMNLLM